MNREQFEVSRHFAAVVCEQKGDLYLIQEPPACYSIRGMVRADVKRILTSYGHVFGGNIGELHFDSKSKQASTTNPIIGSVLKVLSTRGEYTADLEKPYWGTENALKRPAENRKEFIDLIHKFRGLVYTFSGDAIHLPSEYEVHINGGLSAFRFAVGYKANPWKIETP